MDPKWLNTTDWQQIAAAVNLFWFFAASLVVSALSFGLAQALIPSLVKTRHLPARLALGRTPLYVVSLAAILLAAFSLYNAISSTYAVLRDIYPRWWV